MAGFLLLLCVVAIGVAGTIMYLLFGPTTGKPVVVVPRASLTTMAAPSSTRAGAYSPEAVFAAEDAHLAARTIAPAPLAPALSMMSRERVTAPHPLPRTRAARGTDSPRFIAPPAAPESYDARDSFLDIDPSMVVDDSLELS